MAIKKQFTLLFSILLLSSSLSAQIIGLGGSATLMQSAGAVDGVSQRLTPFLFGKLPKVGSVRLEWSPSALERSSQTLDEAVKINRYGVHLGLNGGLLFGESYLLLSWNRVSVYDDGFSGDVDWNEWGLGYGVIWPLNRNIALFLEAEHIWSGDEHEPSPVEDISVDRRGWQMQLGFVAFLY